jgi:hypothetical protein
VNLRKTRLWRVSLAAPEGGAYRAPSYDASFYVAAGTMEAALEIAGLWVRGNKGVHTAPEVTGIESCKYGVVLNEGKAP